MDVIGAIRARRSIRKYEHRSIPSEVMEQLLDAARLAPSASNLQSWNIVVVTDPDLRERLVPCCGGQRFVGDCAAFLVGVVEQGSEMSVVDVSIALDHLSLRAVEMGLGTCWIGDFEPEKVKEKLGIPAERAVPICMTLGYPVSVPPARKRKQLSELFNVDRWSDLWG